MPPARISGGQSPNIFEVPSQSDQTNSHGVVRRPGPPLLHGELAGLPAGGAVPTRASGRNRSPAPPYTAEPRQGHEIRVQLDTDGVPIMLSARLRQQIEVGGDPANVLKDILHNMTANAGDMTQNLATARELGEFASRVYSIYVFHESKKTYSHADDRKLSAAVVALLRQFQFLGYQPEEANRFIEFIKTPSRYRFARSPFTEFVKAIKHFPLPEHVTNPMNMYVAYNPFEPHPTMDIGLHYSLDRKKIDLTKWGFSE